MMDFEMPTQEIHTVVMSLEEVEFPFLKWYCVEFGFVLVGVNQGFAFLRRKGSCFPEIGRALKSLF